MRKIHPADPSTVFWFWSQCLEDLIGWATDPDPEVISTDGWREHFRNDIRDKGNRARDASPDGVTRNQVTRSRRLASRLVRMLNETPELNERPCRNWSQVDRLVVEQLADLQVVFANVSDGATKVVAVVATPQRQLEQNDPAPASANGGVWHEAGATPPSEYPAGPLTGTKGQLVKWILRKTDYRLLETALKPGTYWGREDSRTQCSVWFKTQTRYSEANGQRMADSN